jgi:hypothetical protein
MSALEKMYIEIHRFNGSVCESVKLNYLTRGMLVRFVGHKCSESFGAWLANFMMLPQIINFDAFAAL